MENLRIDENSRWTLGGVANDGSGDIKNARVNPITGALIVEATVTSTNTQIGSTIPGGTAGSVLFLGLGGTLAQDNANFFYDDTNNYLGLGTTTPNATLDVQGTAIITGSAGTPTFVLGRDGSGNVSNIVLGSNLTLTGGVLSANTSGSGYNQIQDDGTNITQRTTLNFVDYFTVTDGSGKTNVSINTAELGADTTLISTLETNMDLANISGQIDLSTQVTGTLSSTNIDITNLESNLDLANIAGQIDLTTQVSGALSLSNGGTGQALTDPNYDAVYVWDNTTNTTRLAQLSGISYDSGTNILSSTGGSGTSTTSGTITQAAHGFTIGYPTPVRKDASGIYVKSLAVKTSSADLSGEVIGIAVASTVNDFVIYYNGQVPTTTTPFSALPTGTPLYVSATTAGTLTDIEPTGTTDISKPVAYVDIETGVNARIVFMNMRGLIGDNSGGSSTYAGGVGFVEMIPTISTVQPITSSTFISTDPTLTTTDNIYISECSPAFGSPGGVNITIYKYSKKPQGYFTYDGSFGTFNCSSVTFGGGTNNPLFLNRPHVYQGNIYVPVINFVGGGAGNSFLFYVIDGTTGTFIGLTNSIIPTGSFSYPSGVNATAYDNMYYHTVNEFPGNVKTWKIQINSISSITLVNTYTNPYVGAFPNGIKLQANNYCYSGVTLYDITAATGIVYDAGYPYMSGVFGGGVMNTVIDNNMALIATESLTGTTLTVNKFYIVPNVGGSPF